MSDSVNKINENDNEKIFQWRLTQRLDELRWLYMELYANSPNKREMFDDLCENMKKFALERLESETKAWANPGLQDNLKMRDYVREGNPNWYKSNSLMGVMLYVDNFAGNLKGVQEKLPWLEETGVNWLHLMPFLNTTRGRSDGGYAVSDFRTVRPDLGTMEDLSALTTACHEKGINVCMDFVMNHTSEDHEWAKKARAGDPEYKSRYFFYDNDTIPNEYERTVPQVFPTTAPGNFTWLDDCKQYVMTTFYPYQWDLNYANPRVFNEMIYNYLFLANKGIDVIRIDAVPYIWKELGTNCRNLPKVHTIVRMMRMIGEIVCPSVILLGEVVMEPAKVVPYFGSVEKPECHLLYNVTTMCTTWHTVATRDARLLRKQLDSINSLPREYVFLNYLRCHDDIGWGLDYATLHTWGMDEVPHKHYLNEYFLGHIDGSVSRGELYNDDPRSGDARFCGTTASLCGIEKAELENDPKALELAIRFDLTLHAMMFMQSGIPMLYSGDEIAQINDYSYKDDKDDPSRAADSRYIHRGRFRWDLADRAHDSKHKTLKNHKKREGTPEYQVFHGLKKLAELRKAAPAFHPSADVWTLDTGDDGLLAIGRYAQYQKIIGVFNFTPETKTVSFPYDRGEFTNMLTGEKRTLQGLSVPPYGFYYMQITY